MVDCIITLTVIHKSWLKTLLWLFFRVCMTLRIIIKNNLSNVNVQWQYLLIKKKTNICICLELNIYLWSYLCRSYGILYSRRRIISPIYLSYNDNTFRFLNYFKGLNVKKKKNPQIFSVASRMCMFIKLSTKANIRWYLDSIPY